jgi:hypothetical protein
MKKIIFIGLLLLAFFNVFGQNASDSIEVKKNLGTMFRQNGQNLTPKQLLVITKSNPDAYKEMKIAKANSDIGSVFGYAGGFLIGYPVGTAIGGGKPNWALAGIGAGLVVVSIPFSIAYSKHAKNAVKIYNNGLNQTGFHNVEFNLGLTCNGIGFKMTF